MALSVHLSAVYRIPATPWHIRCNFFKPIWVAQKVKSAQGTVQIRLKSDLSPYLIHFLTIIGGAQPNIGGLEHPAPRRCKVMLLLGGSPAAWRQCRRACSELRGFYHLSRSLCVEVIGGYGGRAE